MEAAMYVPDRHHSRRANITMRATAADDLRAQRLQCAGRMVAFGDPCASEVLVVIAMEKPGPGAPELYAVTSLHTH